MASSLLGNKTISEECEDGKRHVTRNNFIKIVLEYKQ